MTLGEAVLAALAVWEVIEIWRHGDLFAGLRARTEAYDTWWSYLLGCGFCLAPWTALAVVLAWHYVPAAKLVILAFAVARLANLGNDLAYDWCRTPKSGQE